MSKYTVHLGYYGDDIRPVDTFDEALTLYRANPDAQVFGQGVDFDCDEEGYHMVSDGLTDDERDQLEQCQ